MAGAADADPAGAELAGYLGAAAAARLRHLSGAGELTGEQARELAALLAPIYAGADPEELVPAWHAIAADQELAAAPGDWGTIADAPRGPAAAGLLTKLDQRAFDAGEPTEDVAMATLLGARDRQSMVILGDPTVSLPPQPSVQGRTP
jgi:hypothetical protein